MPWKERNGSGAGCRRTAGCTLQRYETSTARATTQRLLLALPALASGLRHTGPSGHCFVGCRGAGCTPGRRYTRGRGGLDMVPQSLEPEIRRVVAERLGVGQEELTDEVSLFDDLAVDSLDMVELGLALEDKFGITVPEHVLGEVRTYAQVVDRVLDLARAPAADGGEPPFVPAPPPA